MDKIKINKEYGIFNKPSLKMARKRINLETQHISYHLDESLYGVVNNKKYLIVTFGCQGNLSDSEKLSGILEALGFTKCDNEQDADLILYNTCCIRENAENRVFGELGRIKRIKNKKPDLIIGVCGCMMQEEGTVESS